MRAWTRSSHLTQGPAGILELSGVEALTGAGLAAGASIRLPIPWMTRRQLTAITGLRGRVADRTAPRVAASAIASSPDNLKTTWP